jgi:Uri superfamily endonuclease
MKLKITHIVLGLKLYQEIFKKDSVQLGYIGAIPDPVTSTAYHPVYRVRNGKIKGVNRKIGEAWKKSGIYFIKENGKLIYIGYSGSNLYKTILRHFQTWNDKYQSGRISYKDRLFENEYTVQVVYMPAKQAKTVECQLIKEHQPRDNKRKNFWSRSECKGSWTNEKAYIIEPTTGFRVYEGQEVTVLDEPPQALVMDDSEVDYNDEEFDYPKEWDDVPF